MLILILKIKLIEITTFNNKVVQCLGLLLKSNFYDRQGHTNMTFKVFCGSILKIWLQNNESDGLLNCLKPNHYQDR